jgi:hypothetical protein
MRVSILAAAVCCTVATSRPTTHSNDAMPKPCCAWGGSGSAYMFAIATIAGISWDAGAAPSSSELVSVALGLDAVNSISTVLVNSSDPETAVAGWIISQNATAQTLTFWNGNGPSRAPNCYSASVPLPDSYMPGFSFCPGGPGSAFPVFTSSFLQGTQQVNWYAQNVVGSAQASFTDGTCVPVSVLGATSPLGGGAFGFTVVGGAGDAPPASWASPPSACNL